MRDTIRTLSLLLVFILSATLLLSCVSTTTTQQPPDDDDSDIVYITDTGKKFHRGDCRYLSQSKIPIARKNALKQGFTPCSVVCANHKEGTWHQ